jgi:hypothetical protein
MFPKLCLLDAADKTQAVSNGDSTTGIDALVSRVLDDKPDFDSFATTSSSGLQGSSKVFNSLGSPFLGNVSWNCKNMTK